MFPTTFLAFIALYALALTQVAHALPQNAKLTRSGSEPNSLLGKRYIARNTIRPMARAIPAFASKNDSDVIMPNVRNSNDRELTKAGLLSATRRDNRVTRFNALSKRRAAVAQGVAVRGEVHSRDGGEASAIEEGQQNFLSKQGPPPASVADVSQPSPAVAPSANATIPSTGTDAPRIKPNKNKSKGKAKKTQKVNARMLRA